MLPFDSQESYDLNSEVFRTIKELSNKASKHLARQITIMASGSPK